MSRDVRYGCSDFDACVLPCTIECYSHPKIQLDINTEFSDLSHHKMDRTLQRTVELGQTQRMQRLQETYKLPIELLAVAAGSIRLLTSCHVFMTVSSSVATAIILTGPLRWLMLIP